MLYTSSSSHSFVDHHRHPQSSRRITLLTAFLVPTFLLTIILLRTFHPLSLHAPLHSPAVSRGPPQSAQPIIGGRWTVVRAVLDIPLPDVIGPITPDASPRQPGRVKQAIPIRPRSEVPADPLWVAHDVLDEPDLTLEQVEAEFRAAGRKEVVAQGSKKAGIKRAVRSREGVRDRRRRLRFE